MSSEIPIKVQGQNRYYIAISHDGKYAVTFDDESFEQDVSNEINIHRDTSFKFKYDANEAYNKLDVIIIDHQEFVDL
ncbi:10645_t:CDS:2 [Funneliformis geosporum]|nr:10645_t:CDS:2 [Funneliformis geosporum]